MKMDYMLLRKTIKQHLHKVFVAHNHKAVMAVVGSVLVIGLLGTILLRTQHNMGIKEAGIEIASLARNIRQAYQIRPDFWGLNSESVIDKGLYPRSMKVVDGKLFGYFGNEVAVGADRDGSMVMPTMRHFVIAYRGLDFDQCVAVASNSFNQEFWLGVTSVTVVNARYNETFEWGSAKDVLPLKKQRSRKLCQKQNNMIVFGFN